MKDKIIYLLIGIILGAILSTAGFIVYDKTIENDSEATNTTTQQPNGQMGTPPSGNGSMTPPDMPEGENGTAPTKPTEQNITTNNNTNE